MSVLVPNRDAMELLPAVRELWFLLQEAMSKAGHPIRIIEGYRSPERQDYLYSVGRTLPGKVVTNARAWQSWHQTRRSFDVCFESLEPFADTHPWSLLGQAGETLGLEWGGRWKRPDRPHFQLTEGLTLAEAAEAERAKRVNKGG